MDFIHQEYLQDLSICDKLIDYHKNTLSKGPGLIGIGNKIIPELKDSIDCAISHGDILDEYNYQLQKIVDHYIEKFKFCNDNQPWMNIESPNIQYYKPGMGYKIWHCERGTSQPPNSTRHLAYMSYLNDVSDAGGTEFYYQKLITKPQKGLTLIWPVDWTHTHRGVVSPTQEKYIITGWFSYYKLGEIK